MLTRVGLRQDMPFILIMDQCRGSRKKEQTVEAEYMAMTAALQEMLYLRQLLAQETMLSLRLSMSHLWRSGQT